MTFCGTDIRIKSIHSKRTRYSHYCNYSKFHSDNLIKFRMYWLNLFINRFFAVRELYSYAISCIPKSKIAKTPWLNNLGFNISTAIYKKPKKIQPEVIKIVHAPSNPKVKGTFFIRKSIKKLKKMGFKIEYIELIGVPNDKVQKVISNADIVIDQILIGEISTLCFEGMGFGKPVISYLPDNIKKDHFPDCPIFNANIDNLIEKIIALINDPCLRYELGLEGENLLKIIWTMIIQKQVIEEYKKIGF